MNKGFKISGLLSVTLAAALMVSSAAARADTITVDMNSVQGNVNYAGSGFLHGFNDVTPSSSLITPLKPKLFRTGPANAFKSYARAKSFGIPHLQLALSDSRAYQAPWPGDNGDWNTWLNLVTNVINQAKANGQTFEWDLWNEPDAGGFWRASRAQFFETWTRTFKKVRELNPSAVIVGPSIANYGDGSWMRAFLLHAKATGTLPNILSWHEFDSGGASFEKDTADVRAFMAQNGINIPRISINEYLGNNESLPPGVLVDFLAAIGRTKIESAAHSCWPVEAGTTWNCNTFNLDGILTLPDKQPRAQWWVYKAYADMAGTLVNTTPSVATIDAIASRDSVSKKAQVIVGRSSKTNDTVGVSLVIKNISTAAPFLVNGGKVHAVVTKVHNKYQNGFPAPLPVINADYAVTNGQITIGLNANATDAFMVTLGTGSGGGTGTPDTTVPSVPLNLNGTATSSSVNLTWSASNDTGGSGLGGYKVYRNGVLAATVTGTSASVTGLTANTSYNFTVASFDNAGNNSAQGAIKAIKTLAGGTTTNLPDVVVTAVNYANGVFSATVKNQGTVATPAGGTIGVGYSVDGTYRTYGYVITSLAAGASVNIGTQGGNYTIPNGTHTILANADDAKRFNESNETNNTLSKSIVVGTTSNLPDMVVTNITYSAGKITATVKNQGTVATPTNVGIGVGFLVNGSYKTGTLTSGSLAAGASRNIVGNYTLANGTFTVAAVVDDAKRFAESNENNNTLSKSITVGTTGGTKLPDMVVTNITYSAGKITATVKNQGTAATPTGVGIGVGFLVNGSYKTGTLIPTTLAVGASMNIVGNYTIPKGTFNVTANVDDAKRFVELNDNNNVLTKSITVP